MRMKKLFDQFVEIDRKVALYGLHDRGRSDSLFVRKLRKLLAEIIADINQRITIELFFAAQSFEK